MSYIFEAPFNPPQQTAANGQASLMEIGAAASEHFRLVENTNARYEALSRAYDERIEAIASATGQRIESPFVTAPKNYNAHNVGSTGLSRAVAVRENEKALVDEIARFDRDLIDLEKRFPEASSAIRADLPVMMQAAQMANKSEHELTSLAASNPSWLSGAAEFVGAMHGWFQDPLQVSTLAAGAGPAMQKTAAARILGITMREAAINGVVEAAVQPTVQNWRKEIGLESGLDLALKNIGFATIIGGGFGTVSQTGAEVVTRLLSPAQVDDVAAALANDASLPTKTQDALAGDGPAAAELLGKVRDELPPEARGAIDQIELDSLADSFAVEHPRPEIYADELALAERAANGDQAALDELRARPGDYDDHAPFQHDYAQDQQGPRMVDDPFDLDAAELDYELDLIAANDLDLAVPNADGDIVPLRDLIEDARHGDELAKIVSACKI